MRPVKLSLMLVALLVIAAYALHRPSRFSRAQASSSPSSPLQGNTTHPSKTYRLFAGLWRVDGDFVSTLHVKNSLVVGPMEVTPVLYMADGTRYSLPPLTLATAGVAVINVNQALAQAPPRIAKHLSQYGSVALRYRYSSPGHVLASMQILNVPESLSFTYSFNGVAEGDSGPQRVEGLWWKRDPDVGGFVSIANVTDEPLEVGVQAIGSRGTAMAEEEFQVAGHAAQMLDLDELTADLPGLENQAGGIRVQYVGKPGAIVVAGGLVNEREGYSANMPFCPGSMASSEPAELTFASVGLMVGKPDPMMGFPRGTRFVPYLALRNTTTEPLALTPVLNYMADGQPVSRTLPAQRLAPLEARQVDLHAAIASLGLAHFNGNLNVTLSYRGHAGDVMVATGSVDETGTYVFEVDPEGLGRSSSKIASYWSIADGFDTMFSLWNPQPEAEDVLVTFYYADGSGEYKLPVHLAGQASTMIDMEMLIMSQQPDPDGHVIPSTVQLGSATFASAKGKTQPLTLNISVGTFNVETATCCTNKVNCCGWSNFTTGPANGSCPVGDTMQCSAQATNCDGTPQTFSATWSSSNTAIATISSTGLMKGISPGSVTISAAFPSLVLFTGTLCPPQTCPMHAQSASSNEDITPTVVISGPHEVPLVASGTSGPNQVSLSSSVDPSGGTYSWSTSSTNKVSLSGATGSAVTVTSVSKSAALGDVTITLTYTYNNIPGSSSTFMTVQQPTYLNLASNISSGAASCAAGQAGPDRKLWWQVEDQFTGSIQFGGMPVSDNFAWAAANGCNSGNSNGCNLNNFTVTPPGETTNSSGQGTDHYSMCTPCCYNGGKCTTTANQTYSVNGFSILKNPSYTCSGLTINGQ